METSVLGPSKGVGDCLAGATVDAVSTQDAFVMVHLATHDQGVHPKAHRAFLIALLAADALGTVGLQMQ